MQITKVYCLLLTIICKKSLSQNSELIVLEKGKLGGNESTLHCTSDDADAETVRTWVYENPQGNITTLPETSENLVLTELTQVGEYNCNITNGMLKNFTVAHLATPIIPVSNVCALSEE